MFGIGIFELLIIAVVCLMAFGPKQMPVVVRKLAGFYRQFALLREEIRFQMLSAENSVKDEQEKDLKLTDGEK